MTLNRIVFMDFIHRLVSVVCSRFVCVCFQVCCSVVCNLVLLWFVCGCFVISSVQVFSFFAYNFIFLVLRHQTMDKVHKHNSINTNTPSSESYRSDVWRFIHLLIGSCVHMLWHVQLRAAHVSIVTVLRSPGVIQFFSRASLHTKNM
jgi:hypothetical protein